MFCLLLWLGPRFLTPISWLLYTIKVIEYLRKQSHCFKTKNCKESLWFIFIFSSFDIKCGRSTDFHLYVFYTLKLALHNHYFPFWRQFFVLCLCNKTVKDLAGKKRDRDRGTVTLRPTAPYVTIIWGGIQKYNISKIQNCKM